ncbi:MAG: hypothetical protein M5U01_38570 [Ardenticatenaceae bacterium]|nr:hypothetical protein [Ardenticatenaceae bacterium]
MLFPSVILGLLLGLDSYRDLLNARDAALIPAMVPLVAVALTVGLFEAVFFYGWLQLRFEEAFGVIPSLLLASLAYNLY